MPYWTKHEHFILTKAIVEGLIDLPYVWGSSQELIYIFHAGLCKVEQPVTQQIMG